MEIDSALLHSKLKTFFGYDEKELDMKTLEKIGPVKRLTTEEVFGY